MSAAETPVDPSVTAQQNAMRHVELLTGDVHTRMFVRLIHDRDRAAQAIKLCGTVRELWLEIEAAQSKGYGAFIVVNEGGNSDSKITAVRAVFIDADSVPLETIRWHLRPDFIVQRDATHWHAYWLVTNLPPSGFHEVQKRLAAHYGTDPAVCNPSRVMRLAGTLHLKGAQ